MRVVSLVPSATEILCALGAADLLVGRSHECDWPASILGVPMLTGARTHAGDAPGAIDAMVRTEMAEGRGLYTLDAALLTQLRPDVILTQDLCGVCSIDVDAVRRVASSLRPEPRVVSLNPKGFEDMLEDVLRVGEAIGLTGRAQEVLLGLRARFYGACDYVNAYAEGPSVAFLEWTDPLFIGGHWTPQLIERAGGRHPLNPSVAVSTAGAGAGPAGMTLRGAGPSVTVPPAVLAASRPDALIIAPCGRSLAQAGEDARALSAQPWWGDLPAVRRGKVALVDGNQFFNRPGPRLVDAFEWLVGWLNDRPELIPQGFAWRPWSG